MRALWFTFLFSTSLLFAGGTNSGSVFLLNDSPFILTATVLGADGSFLGELTVQPGEQTKFTQNFNSTNYDHPGFPSVSFTPYTIVWQCPSQGYYSVCTQVSPGSFVKASGCPGTYFCSPKEKDKKDDTAPPASTIQKKK